MPTYTYKCCNEECEDYDKLFEVTQKMSDDKLVYCPCCMEPTLSKVIGSTQVILKGEGWPGNENKGIVHYDPKTYKKPT